MKDEKQKLYKHTEKLWTFQSKQNPETIKTKNPETVGTTNPETTVETTAPEKNRSREPRSNPNRLFEALLATLPHLQSLEENLAPSQVN